MLFVNDGKKYVATYKEIILAFIAFSIILFVLYPKDLLQTQILSEKSNYDLSMLYLKNMLKNDPSNETLMLNLAEQGLDTGKKDLALELLNLLHNSKNYDIKFKSYMLSYKLDKDNYYYLRDHNQTKKQEIVYENLQKLFKTIISKKLYNNNSLEYLYKEASFLKDDSGKYFLMNKLLKDKPDNVALIEDAYYLSRKLDKNKKALYYVDRLISLDSQNRKKWYEAKYNLIVKNSTKKEIESFLKQKANSSKFWSDKLIGFYINHKRYKDASKMYMRYFKHTKSFVKKRDFWLKAISALRFGNYNKKAIALGYRYERYFLHDKKARVELLKLYIALNDLRKARNLSKKILRLKRR